MQGQYYRLLYHAVWSTKYREPLLDEELRPAMHRYLKAKIRECGGMALSVGGTADHVHLVFSAPPQMPVASLIGKIKGASSHWVNHVFRPGARFAWQNSYSAFSISSRDLRHVCTYVNNQEEHHRRGTLDPNYEEPVTSNPPPNNDQTD